MLRYINNKHNTMAKLYSSKKVTSTVMKPKKETINNILSYSRSLKIFKIGKLQFEYLAN